MPNPYRKLLVAIDCSDDTSQVIARAAGLGNQDAELHLIHVIEPLALAYGADVPMDVSDLQQSMLKNAKEKAKAFAKQYSVPEERIHVLMGSIEKTVQEQADQLDCDLIVVGSHTRSGLALLLGSTAKGIMPGARCDVLAVKIPQS